MPLEEVEPAAEIVKRFATGAMTLGSISTEAHTTLAVAMNRIGGKSNTGEGGEDPRRYPLIAKGETLRRRASTACDRSDIRAQGRRLAALEDQAGRLGALRRHRGISASTPTSSRSRWRRARSPAKAASCPATRCPNTSRKLRYSVPGVGLISPPPHHDIYSIEDLAQLIHDLKNANPQASISVKLVSEVGVGTVAAGVAKAKADHVTIAGHDGGTGASPLSSIKHAGTPWELGLAETQQTLVLNRLRGRIAVQVDGQMKTGRDVVIGALLGADEFGFATAPLVVEGCIMMRKCHLNTCPVGIATQDPELRKKFTGQPEHVVNYFFFVAEEVREIMAKLGFRKFDEMIGRSDLLDMRAGHRALEGARASISRASSTSRTMPPEVARYHCETQDHGLARALDHQLIARGRAGAREEAAGAARRTGSATRNRSVGAMLSGTVARKYGHAGLPDDTIHVAFDGIAGQSFGAFLARGVTFELQGATNDYVGKGLSGGRIVVYPDPDVPGEAGGQHRHRQHGDVRRDRRRGLFPRRRRRALLRAQFGRDGGGRRHGRPRLRIHDRRHRRRARAAPGAISPPA